MFIEVEGGGKAAGEMSVQGAKNAVLPMIAATVLCRETVVLERCPKIQDVYSMIAILREIGASVSWDDDRLVIDAGPADGCEITEDEAGRVRASVLFLGSVLGRSGQVGICLPGGCSIGARPIDYHMEAFRRMGAAVSCEEDRISCTVEGKGERKVVLPYPSVGATENVILFAALRDGATELYNAAKEPEIVELCRFMRSMGARIGGEGSSVIRIDGVRRLHGTVWCPRPDRIVFLTYAAMAAATGGDVYFRVPGGEFEQETEYLRQAGCEIRREKPGIRVSGANGLRAIPYIRTGPYPEFPTDAQSLFMALMTRAYGESILEESVFENRFLVAAQLRRLGADIEVADRQACVRGVTRLHGGRVRATDLRSGAALMVAGLMAEGKTRIEDSQLILRGYETPVEYIQCLGMKAGYGFD